MNTSIKYNVEKIFVFIEVLSRYTGNNTVHSYKSLAKQTKRRKKVKIHYKLQLIIIIFYIKRDNTVFLKSEACEQLLFQNSYFQVPRCQVKFKPKIINI